MNISTKKSKINNKIPIKILKIDNLNQVNYLSLL